MTKRFSRFAVGLVAALCAQAGFAATATIVASSSTPAVGDTFTVTVQADVPNTLAATMALSFDDTKVAYVSGAVAGLFSPGNFTKNSPTTQNPTVFDIDTASATPLSPGTYNAVVLTFQAVAPGNAAIVIDDDGGNLTGWFDASTFDVIPVTYTQASVTVNAAGPNIVVTDDVSPAGDHAVAFGGVNLNTVATHTVTVTNAGSSNLTLSQVGAVQVLAAPFSLVNDNCSNQVVAAAASCTFQVEFQPVAAGSAGDSLDIPSDDGDTPSVIVAVSGAGVDPAADPQPTSSGGGSAVDAASLLALALLGLAARRRRA